MYGVSRILNSDRLIRSGIWPSMAAAAELILRSPVGAKSASFRWPPAVPVCLSEFHLCLAWAGPHACVTLDHVPD